MKKSLMILLLFIVCFGDVLPYPVYIVDMENSTRAVVPWDVKDTKKFTTKVKNPIPNEYWVIGKEGWWPIDRGLLDSLYNEGFKMNYVKVNGAVTGSNVDFMVAMSDVKNVNKLISVLKKDPNFINISPVDASDKISKRIWNNEEWTRKSKDSKEFAVDIYFKYKSDRELIDKAQMAEILYGFECVFPGECTEYHYYFQSRYATFEQIIELVKNPLVAYVLPTLIPEPVLDIVRSSTWTDNLQKNFPPNFEWIIPTVGWLDDSLYGNNGIITGAGINVAVNEHPKDPVGNDKWGYRHLDLSERGNISNDTLIRMPGARVLRGQTSKLSPLKSEWYLTSHGTGSAGTIGGNGWTLNNGKKYRGIAPGVLFYTSGDSGHVNNHSFTGNKKYDYYHKHTDTSLSQYGRIGVFSAGNWVTSLGPNGGGYISLTQDHKNGIIVGGVYKDNRVLSPKSSLGPNKQGMIKPDIVAPGMGIFPKYLTTIFPKHPIDTVDLEFDSIAIINKGVKKYWNFSDSSEIWDFDFNKATIKYANGKMKADSLTNSSYFFSKYIYPNYISNINDTLYMKLRCVRSTNGIYDIPISFRWRTTNGEWVYNGHPYLEFKVIIKNIGNIWTEVKVPLKNISMDEYTGWESGLEVTNFAMWMVIGSDNGIVSCNNENGYVEGGGTSQAGPVVTGVVALMLQKYRDGILTDYNKASGTNHNLRSYPMWNSTAKAILIHTAVDLIDTGGLTLGYNYDTKERTVYGKGPDWATGWGFVNAERAVNYVNAERFRQDVISENDSIVYYMYVPKNKSFRITTDWDDPIVDKDTSTWKLQNNIDTYAIRKLGVAVTKIGYPWVLDPNPIIIADSLGSLTNDIVRANPARRGIDSINTVEVIDVDPYPTVGFWQIIVKGKNFNMDQNPTKPGTNQDFSIVTDYPIGRYLIPFDTSLTVESMLNFRNIDAWSVDPLTPWTELEYVYVLRGTDTIVPTLNVFSDRSYAAIIGGKQIDTYVGSNVESLIAGLTISFSENPRDTYRGNLQVYIGNDWAGQFDINSYGNSVRYDRSTDKWYAYYEFVLPSPIVVSLKQSPKKISLKFSAIKNGSGTFTLRQLKFTDRVSENSRDLTVELTAIANNPIQNPERLTPAQIKNLACQYGSYAPPYYCYNHFKIYYRDMQNPQTGQIKRFYYQIRQDVDAPMQFVEWWAFSLGYDPQIPWNSNSYWRQCWYYLGNE